MAAEATDVAALGTHDLSVAVVAQLIVDSARRTALPSPAVARGGRGCAAQVAEVLVRDLLGTEVAQWLGDSAPDGEHVVFLVDAVRTRCDDDPLLRSAVATTVAGTAGVARSLQAVGESCQSRNQRGAALLLYAAWLALARAQGDVREEVDSLRRLAGIHEDMGAPATAAACHERRRVLLLGAGEDALAAEVLIDLGWLHSDSGALSHAAHCFDHAAVELQTLRPLSVVPALVGLAQVRRRQGRREEAMTLLGGCGHVVGPDGQSETSRLLRWELATAYEEAGRLDEAGELHGRSGTRQAAAAASVAALRQLARIRMLQSRPLDAAAHYLDSIAADSSASRLGGAWTAEDADATAAALRLVTSARPTGHGPAEDRDVLATLARPLFSARRGRGYAVAGGNDRA